jgi:branched-subunit amino acid transport protein
MDAHATTKGNAAAKAAVRSLPASIILMGLCLGALTGAALWALRPEVCSELCSVHAFLAGILTFAIALYFAFGRQEGLPAAMSFALGFGAGVMLVALAVSAARISAQIEDADVALEPVACIADGRVGPG